MTYLIGADPEVFVQDPITKMFVSAFNLVPGDKANPFKVPLGAVQVDGMALEFNIDPAATRDEFVRNITGVYHELQQMVPHYNLVATPVAHFNQEYFDQCDPSSKILGCDPDYNAYTGRPNSPPQGNKPMRTAAGHIHIGWTQDEDPFDPLHFADCIAVVKQLDAALGLQSLSFDPDSTRRSMYGKAGAFRPKSYGVEYRVLSNVWLQSVEMIGWVYDTTQQALQSLERGTKFYDSWNEANIADIINTSRTKDAHYYLPRNLPALPKAA